MNFIKSYFQLDKYKTSVKVEFLAGLTTFISMSYILFVNPSVLGASGMDKGAVFTATALASALGTALMGIVANYACFMGNSISCRFRCLNHFYFNYYVQVA